MPQPTNATAQLDIHARAHNVVHDVKAMYGAVGDGSTDDQAVIQAAVTAALVAGGDVFFPPSSADYYCANNVTVPVGANPFRLRGFNRVASRIRFAANKGFIVGDNSALTHYWSIDNLGIRRTTPDTTPLLDLNKCDQFQIRGCAITGGSVDLSACITGNMLGSQFNTAADGDCQIILANCDQILINDNTFENQRVGSTNSKHIKAGSGNQHVVIGNNSFSSNAAPATTVGVFAIEIGTGSNINFAIIGNEFANVSYGIDLDAAGVGLAGGVVAGNTISGISFGGSIGLNVGVASGVVVTGNRIANFPGNSIAEAGGASGNLIYGNVTDAANSLAGASPFALQMNGPLAASGGKVGFYGTAPIVKPAVTGSRAGNAALASALTQLAALGLITDSSSA